MLGPAPTDRASATAKATARSRTSYWRFRPNTGR